MRHHLHAWCASLAVIAAASHGHAAAKPDIVRGFLDNYCVKCHGNQTAKAKLNLQSLQPAQTGPADAETWQEVVDRLTLGDMPPEGSKQPGADEKLAVLELIRSDLTRAKDARTATSEVVLRRLNRVEYNNTMRDLTGLDLRLGDRFPADIAVDGFDNVGKALTVSPYLMEQYLETAKTWLDKAILVKRPETAFVDFYPWRGGMGGVELHRNRKVRSFEGMSAEEQARQIKSGPRYSSFVDESEWNYIRIPHEGRYRFRVLLSGYRSGAEAGQPRVRFIVAAAQVGSVSVPAPVGKQGEPTWFRFEAWLPAGIYNFRGEHLNPDRGGQLKLLKEKKSPTSFIQAHWCDIEGPLYDAWPPEFTRRVLPPNLIDRSDEAGSARRVLARFMRRAWRRPVTDAEVAGMVALFQEARPGGGTFEEAIRLPLAAVLSSPHFLFLVEKPNPTGRLSGHEIAARLSYFLWSSMPDEELFGLAENGDLGRPDVRAAQVDRMLADPKAEAFVNNFVGQWLDLRRFGTAMPDAKRFPQYDFWLEESMRRETTLFFTELLSKNLSVLNLVDSDFTMLNDVLARHYGIGGVEGAEFRRVALPADGPRGGVLTQASVLTLTADGRETSPVHRGTWILKNFLGTPPPPPPPSVPELEESVAKAGAKGPLTIRQKLDAHRNSPACAGCHSKIDPLGFALESFDAIGAVRTHVDENRQMPVEAFGKLPDGTTFDGAKEFKRVLLERRREVFLRGLTGKLLTYALGRPVGFADRAAVDGIIRTVEKDGHGLRSLVKAVVAGDTFVSP